MKSPKVWGKAAKFGFSEEILEKLKMRGEPFKEGGGNQKLKKTKIKINLTQTHFPFNDGKPS